MPMEIMDSKIPETGIENAEKSEISDIIWNTIAGISPETDMVPEQDMTESAEMLVRANDSIQEHAETPQEKQVAAVLSDMMANGKIRIVDTYEEIGQSCFGYYDLVSDTICLDRNAMLDYGTAETIDTLTHEGYHAAQHAEGHRNDSVEEETRAWNTGLEMGNKYREEQGETVVRTESYTQADILSMGSYHHDLGPGVFQEIQGRETPELA